MKLLEKYICGNYIAAFAFCITLLMVLGAIGDILGFLDDIFKNSIPLASILMFYFYFAPFAFVTMVPFAVLLAAVFVFNNLSKNHEMTAIIASGISIWKTLRPVLIATFGLCLLSFIVNDKLVPPAMEKASLIRQEKLESSGGTVKNLAVYGKGDIIIFARAYDPAKKTLQNLILHNHEKDGVVFAKISARSAKWREEGYWLGTDVMVFKSVPGKTAMSDPEVYKSKKLPIQEGPKDFVNTQWDPRLMGYRQLRDYIDVIRSSSPGAVRRLLVELNYKLAFPFTALVMVLVGIPFSIATGRANVLIGVAKGVSAGLLYLPFLALGLALGKGGVLPPIVSVWATNVIFACWGVNLINRRT